MAFFILYILIEDFPFQEYYTHCCRGSSRNNTHETAHFPAPTFFNPIAARAQPEPIIPSQLPRDQMTRGISRAHCVVVFITERYASKINSANPGDNCYYEFNFAVHRVSSQKMIPVVMEEMKDTKQWQGRLAAELANHLYVNMSDVIGKIIPESIGNNIGDNKKLQQSEVTEHEVEEFDQKCKEIVELVGSVLVKPLKDLTLCFSSRVLVA